MKLPKECDRNKHLLDAYPGLVPVCDERGIIMAFTFGGGWREDWLAEGFELRREADRNK